MITRKRVSLLFLLLTALLPGQSRTQTVPPAAVQSPPLSEVNFACDVMPLLSSLGCNQARCHASVGGKGGLQLSMFGADTDLDYLSLTRLYAGLRINAIEVFDPKAEEIAE